MKAKAEWKLAMNDEIASRMENETSDLVKLPKSKHALHNKWVYRLKEENDGTRGYKAKVM